ncbi:MAG: acyl-CoA thioesterase [Oligoflexales bacterium]
MQPELNISADVEIEVPFHDVDLLNVAWHGHYFKYFELARTELMRKLDLDWPAVKSLGFAMPVVNANVSYRNSLSYGKKAIVTASIHEYGLPELIVNYCVRDKDTNATCTVGTTRQLYWHLETGTTQFLVPDLIRQRFETYLEGTR